MKRVILHIALLILSFSLSAQKVPQGQLKKADKLFENFEYQDAAVSYEGIIEKAPDYEYAKIQLIKCYEKLNKTEESLPLYAGIVRSGSATADNDFKLQYVQALMETGNYGRAMSVTTEVLANSQGNRLALAYMKGLENMDQFYLDSARYMVKEVDFNSEESDYAPALYNGGVVFLSNRTDFQLVKSINTWDNLGYYQPYYQPSSDSVLLAQFDKNLGVKFNGGPAFFYNQDSAALFTSNSRAKSKDGSYKLQLYKTVLQQNGKWSKPAAFDLNDSDHNMISPFLNQTQDTIYFASDRPEGYGGLDIYRSTLIEGKWTDPKNLGSDINTEKNDFYPYQQNGVFYFASEGHYGMGGIDIYKLEVTDSLVINLGAPTNSSRDDFGLVLDSANMGYFSSSRKGGTGSDDIYSIIISKPKTEQLIIAFEDEETGEPINNIQLAGLMDSNSYSFRSEVLEDGQLSLTLPLEHLFKLRFSKEGYVTKELDYQSEQNDLTQVNLTVKLLKQLVVTETVIDVNDGQLLDSVEVVFTNLSTNGIDSLNTNEGGYFSLDANRNTDYNVYLKRTGYFNYNKTVTTRPDSLGLILFNLSMEKIDLGRGVEIADIYFELGSVELTAQSKTNLDSLVNIMNDNPNITIELGSHTDSSGSSLFNLNISERRAIAVAQYLSSKGIDAIRLVAKGYGETEPLNGCVDGVPCTKEQMDVNRRLEFKVLSY